jgi:hypothetical protein
MIRLHRFRWILIPIVLVLAGVFGIGLWLRSTSAATYVAKQVEKQLGAKVAISRISIGMNSTQVRGLDIYDSKDPELGTWLHIQEATLDLPVWKLLRGETAELKIDVEQAKVELRFDSQKDLITSFPQPKSSDEPSLSIPPIHLKNSEFLIYEPGKPTFHLSRIDATIESQDNDIVLVGKIDDPDWGDWSVKGKTDTDFKRFELILRSPEGYTFDRNRFNQVPVLDPSFWDNVPINGEGQVVLKFRTNSQPKVDRDERKIPEPPSSIGAFPIFILRWIVYFGGLQDEQSPANRFALNFNLKAVDLSELTKKLGLTTAVPISGKITTQARLSIDTDHPDDLSRLRVEGSASVPELTLSTFVLKSVQTKFRIRNKILELTDLQANSGLLEGSGKILLEGKYPFNLGLEVKPRPWQELFERFLNPTMLDGIQANLAGTLKIEGTSSPLQYVASGQLSATKVKLGNTDTPDLNISVKAVDGQLQLTSNTWKAFGGSIDLKGTVPFDSNKPGEVTLKLDDVQLNDITKALPGTKGIRITGAGNGSVVMQLVPIPGMVDRNINFLLDLGSTGMRFQGILVERLKGSGQYIDGVLEYKLSGDALGGKIELDGKYPSDSKDALGALEGKLSIRSLALRRILPFLNQEDLSRSLDADIQLDFPHRLINGETLLGNGTIQIANLRYRDRTLSQLMNIAIRFSEKEYRLEVKRGELLGGVVRGVSIFNRQNLTRGLGWVRIENVELSHFVPPERRKDYDALAEVSWSGAIGVPTRGAGTLILHRGKIRGVAMDELRLPFDLEWIPGGPGYLSLRDVTGSVANGRITGKSTFQWSEMYPGRLEGNINFQNLDLSQVIKGSDSIGKVNVTGRVDFNAASFRSLDDLNANIQAKLNESRPFQLPVLENLLPLLGLSSQSLIREGDFRARLQQGLMRLQRFTLVGPNIKFFTEGTVGVDRRLRLQVTALVGNLPGDAELGRFTGVTPLKLVGLSSSLYARVGRLISDRSLRFEVTGTIDRPSVRLQAFQIVTDEAIRFFLNQTNPNLPSN